MTTTEVDDGRPTDSVVVGRWWCCTQMDEEEGIDEGEGMPVEYPLLLLVFRRVTNCLSETVRRRRRHTRKFGMS